MAVSNAKTSSALTVTTPSDREIVLTRVFHAARRLVFEAFTKPEHLVRWFGPHGWTLDVCEVDFRPGGARRFILHGPGSATMGGRAKYTIVSPAISTL